MAKKRVVSIRLDPFVYDRLRRLAFRWDMSLGDVIEGLLNTVAACYAFKGDPKWRERFVEFFDACMRVAGTAEADSPKMQERARRRGWAYKRIVAEREAGRDEFLI